ncbi:hypothetical protein BDF19DRAFT_419745 [Syncephalis fuscata]|nr:hypothetical protein BDF19DRAFT_419745 [Syncephalis fuscata]
MTVSAALPIIDFQTILDPNADPIARKKTIKQIDTAARQYGFFYLINHGIPKQIHDEMRKQTKLFFAKSRAEKEAYGQYGAVRGYHAYTNGDMLQDNLQHETMMFVQSLSHLRNGKPLNQNNDNTALDGADVFGPQMTLNNEPLAEIAHVYREATLKLGRQMISVIATALGSTNSDFEWLNDPYSVLKLNYYPSCEQVTNERNVGMREHTDIGMLTFLDQDSDITSLEIKTIDGEWQFVEPVPNSFIVNLGDMMPPWSNGQYRSAMHRVTHSHSRHRHSIASFFDPQFGAFVPTLKEAVPTGEEPRYPPNCYGDNVLEKIHSFYKFDENA